MRRYQGDPRWITARFAGNCTSCGEAFGKGEAVYYRPNGRHVYGSRCGCAATQEGAFLAQAFDDDNNACL